MALVRAASLPPLSMRPLPEAMASAATCKREGRGSRGSGRGREDVQIGEGSRRGAKWMWKGWGGCKCKGGKAARVHCSPSHPSSPRLASTPEKKARMARGGGRRRETGRELREGQ
jgi:hypothetical protein